MAMEQPILRVQKQPTIAEWPGSSPSKGNERPSVSCTASDLVGRTTSSSSLDSSFRERLDASFLVAGEVGKKKDPQSALSELSAHHRQLAERVAQLADGLSGIQPLLGRLATLEAQMSDQHLANEGCGKQHSAMVWRIGALESAVEQAAERNNKVRNAHHTEYVERMTKVEDELRTASDHSAKVLEAYKVRIDERTEKLESATSHRSISFKTLTADVRQLQETVACFDGLVHMQKTLATERLELGSRLDALQEEARADRASLEERLAGLQKDFREQYEKLELGARLEALQEEARADRASFKERFADLQNGLHQQSEKLNQHLLAVLQKQATLEAERLQLGSRLDVLQEEARADRALLEERFAGLQNGLHQSEKLNQQLLEMQQQLLAAERLELGRLDVQEKAKADCASFEERFVGLQNGFRQQYQELSQQLLAVLQEQPKLQAIAHEIQAHSASQDAQLYKLQEVIGQQDTGEQQTTSPKNEIAQLALHKVQKLREGFLQHSNSSEDLGSADQLEERQSAAVGDSEDRIRSLQRTLAAVEVLVRKEIDERQEESRRLWDAVVDNTPGDSVGARVHRIEARRTAARSAKSDGKSGCAREEPEVDEDLKRRGKGSAVPGG